MGLASWPHLLKIKNFGVLLLPISKSRYSNHDLTTLSMGEMTKNSLSKRPQIETQSKCAWDFCLLVSAPVFKTVHHQITSPELIFSGVNSYSLGETSLSSHSIGFALERLWKNAIFGPFFVHCATLWTLSHQTHFLSWETPIKIEHFFQNISIIILYTKLETYENKFHKQE